MLRILDVRPDKKVFLVEVKFVGNFWTLFFFRPFDVASGAIEKEAPRDGRRCSMLSAQSMMLPTPSAPLAHEVSVTPILIRFRVYGETNKGRKKKNVWNFSGERKIFNYKFSRSHLEAMECERGNLCTSIDMWIYSDHVACSLICSVVGIGNFILTCNELHAISIAQICKCNKKFKNEFISTTLARRNPTTKKSGNL